MQIISIDASFGVNLEGVFRELKKRGCCVVETMEMGMPASMDNQVFWIWMWFKKMEEFKRLNPKCNVAYVKHSPLFATFLVNNSKGIYLEPMVQGMMLEERGIDFRSVLLRRPEDAVFAHREIEWDTVVEVDCCVAEEMAKKVQLLVFN